MTAAAGDTSSALEILIHPLVVMSIADHYTRTKQEQPPVSAPSSSSTSSASTSPASAARVFGLLFGHQDGRSVSVVETVEMAYKRDAEGRLLLQQAALEVDMKLFSASYPSYECLGWYSSGSRIDPEDFDTHKMMGKYNERPLYLLLSPSAVSSTSRDLPLTLYEESIHVVSSSASSEFTRIAYTVHADEAERITSFHCAKLSSESSSQHSSQLLPHYSTLHKAASSLHQRLLLIQRFLDDTAAGSIPTDHATLRDISGLMRRLPVGEGAGAAAGSSERGREMLGEYADSLLLIQLGVLTKTLESLQEMNNKFAVMRSAGGGGGAAAAGAGSGGAEGRAGGAAGLAGQQRGKRGSSGLMALMGYDD